MNVFEIEFLTEHLCQTLILIYSHFSVFDCAPSDPSQSWEDYVTGVKAAVEEMPAVSTRLNVHLSYNARDI